MEKHDSLRDFRRQERIKEKFGSESPVRYWQKLNEDVALGNHESAEWYDYIDEIVARVDGGILRTKEEYTGYIDGILDGEDHIGGDYGPTPYKMSVAYCLHQLQFLER